MAFKTKAELLGDGAGFGAQVPISTTAPAGHGAGNRGVGFGEAITSAVSNRPHAALADNDDALNGRLAPFETGGLDAAYDLGTIGPAGGGRTISKDAGAIETTSTLGALYDDDPANAHFRADASGDGVAGGGGFDFVGQETSAYGYIDRRVVEFTGATSVAGPSMTASLNPGGAGSTIVRLTGVGEFFHTSGSTDLLLGYDLVEVLSGTYAGVYVISSLGGADTDVTVKKLTGSAPTFAASTSVTVRVCRVVTRTGAYSVSGSLANSVMVGMHGTPATLALNSAASSDDSAAVGADDTLLLQMRMATGALRQVGRVDPIGRIVSEVGPGFLTDTVQQRRNGGWHGFIKDYSKASFGSTDHGGGFLAWAGTSASVNPPARLDFLSLINHTITSGVTSSVSVTLGATSPTGGIVTFTASPGSDWEDRFPPFSFVYITTGAELGLYYVIDTNPAGTGTLTLRNLNGAIPSHFGTSGARTLVHFAPQIVGARLQNLPLYSTLRARSVGSQTSTPYNLMVAGGEADATALMLTAPVNFDETTEMRALLRGIKASPTGAHTETFLVEPKGRVYATDGFRTASGGQIYSDAYEYVSTFSRSVQVPLALGQPTTVSSAEWVFSATATAPRWVSAVNSGVLNIPIGHLLRTGQLITNIEVMGTMASGHGTPAAVHLIKRTANWGTPAAPAETTISPSATTAFVAGSASVYSKTYVASNTVTLSTEDWFLKIIAGDTGASNTDWIYAIRITVTDVGPRNH